MIVEQRLQGEWGRDHIEKTSASDLKYGIHPMGTLAERNAFGEIVDVCKHSGRIYPVICGHGGSMWLCRECKNSLLHSP